MDNSCAPPAEGPNCDKVKSYESPIEKLSCLYPINMTKDSRFGFPYFDFTIGIARYHNPKTIGDQVK